MRQRTKNIEGKMNGEGSYTWVVPDGWLPPEGGEGDMINHESLMIMNTGQKDADVKIDIYFDDCEPVKDLSLTVVSGKNQSNTAGFTGRTWLRTAAGNAICFKNKK